MASEQLCADYVTFNTGGQNSSTGLKIFSLLLLSSTTITIIVSYLYFLFHYKSYAFTKARNIFLITVLGTGLFSISFFYSLRGYIGLVNYSCRNYSLTTAFLTLLTLQSCWIRLFSLLWRINYNKLLIKQTYLAFTKGDLKQNPGSVKFVQLTSNRTKKRPSYYANVLESEGTSSYLIGNQPVVQNKVSSKYSFYKEKLLAFILFDVLCIRSSKKYPMNIRIAGVFASPRFASGLYSLIFIISGLVIILVEFILFPPGNDCFNCVLSPTVIAVHVITGLTFLVVFYAVYKLRKVYDSFGIRKELLVIGLSFIVNQTFVEVSVIIGGSLEREGKFDFNLFLPIYCAFISIYIFPYQVWLARKIEAGNVAIEEDEDLLKKLIESTEGRQAFALYLACSLSLENLFFYEAATKWKKDYPSLVSTVQQTTADEVYAQFLSEGAFLLINVSDSCKTKIREALNTELEADIFDEAIATVWDHMTTDIFPRFKKTAYYKASRNELQDI